MLRQGERGLSNKRNAESPHKHHPPVPQLTGPPGMCFAGGERGASPRLQLSGQLHWEPLLLAPRERRRVALGLPGGEEHVCPPAHRRPGERLSPAARDLWHLPGQTRPAFWGPPATPPVPESHTRVQGLPGCACDQRQGSGPPAWERAIQGSGGGGGDKAVLLPDRCLQQQSVPQQRDVLRNPRRRYVDILQGSNEGRESHNFFICPYQGAS